jgi:hypothetical protein
MAQGQGAVQRQIVLPWRQVMKIAFNSLRVRFFRSLITGATLALAVSFVAYLWSGYEILNSIWPHAEQSLRNEIINSGYEMSDGVFGTTAKDRWLAILSILVCVVGIVNAQLMSVTERFREIGTFKCLGALNSFVVRIFMLEAFYQGLFGGVLGSLLGVLVGTLTLAAKFGLIVFGQWPVLQVPLVMGKAVALAVGLSLIGVFYPALVAARMQPASALRSEE